MNRRLLPGLLAVLAVLPTGTAQAQVVLHDGVTIRSLEAAAVRDSNDPVALYELALGYWSKKRWDDAERTLNATLAIEPRNAPALLALAQIPYARRPRLWDEVERGDVPVEWQEALIRGDRLSRLAFLIDPLVDLQVVGAVAPDESSLLHGGAAATPERTIAVGLANFRNGRYDQAYAWFDRLARLFGGDRDPSKIPDLVLWYRGLSAAHLNDIPAALRDFERLHAMGDSVAAGGYVDHTLAVYVLGVFQQRAGLLDEAQASYREALARDLGLWMAHVRLAKIHDDRSEWSEAIRERRLAIAAAPEDASLLLDLGITLSRAGRPDEALGPLAQAQAGLPRNFRVPYWQGLVALQLSRPADAREAFGRFLSLVPSRYTAEIAEVRGRLRTLPGS
ncbi:MAG TPA: tetratricopeptide repeat protein [Gemmatimonadales bacterium]